MNPTLVKAVVVVTLALIFYSIAVITEQRQRFISGRVLSFLTGGILLDIASTVLMIIGSGKIPITIHGFLGYSALTVMLIDTVLIWRFWKKNGGSKISNSLNIYSRIAYIWWVIAYIAGAVISFTIS
jgi:hypothetical protein